MDESIRQVAAALFVAFAEAAGGATARRTIARVINDAIIDHAIDDPAAILFLESLAKDEEQPRSVRKQEAATAA